MKFWLVCDKDGIGIFTSKEKPYWNEREQQFSWVNTDNWTSIDGEYYDSSMLDDLGIKYPKNMAIGECKEFHIRTKTNWK